MSVVVDASVLIAAAVESGPQGLWAEGIIAQGALYAPELALIEATNILRRLERAEKISSADAKGAFDDLMQLQLELVPLELCALRVWELRHTVTSYDAFYVAIAEALKMPLATLDQALARTTGPTCTFLVPTTSK